MQLRPAVYLPIAIGLVGCQSIGSKQASQYLASYQDYAPETKAFQVCHDFGCNQLTSVSLIQSQWRLLASHFSVPAKSASEERVRVKSAIAEFEQLVGPVAGTENDRAGNTGRARDGRQIDCISETVNTTTYLSLMDQQGWLHWHDVALPRHRGWASLLGAHNTAVIRDKKTGKEFAVDSWFGNNGDEPHIVSIDEWKAGYFPPNRP